MCLCDEGSVRSACLPDDLRDAYNKDDEQLRLSQSSVPDRYGKPPSTGGNNVGSSGGSGGSSGSGGNDSGNNGSGGISNSETSASRDESTSRGDSANRGDSASRGDSLSRGDSAGRGVGNVGRVSSTSSSRVATTTSVNSLAMVESRNYCKYPCLNGGTCQGSVCSCRQGYTGEYCGDRKCASTT